MLKFPSSTKPNLDLTISSSGMFFDFDNKLEFLNDCDWPIRGSRILLLRMTTVNASLLFFLDIISSFYNWLVSLLLIKQSDFKVYKKGGILITGCPSKIGMTLAKRLLEEGYIVFAGFKDSTLANQISLDISKPTFIPLHLDVTNQSMINRASQTIRCKLVNMPLVGIVHCAGTSVVGPLEFLSKEDMLEMYSVNTIGPCLVTSAMLDLLRESQGRIIFMSSVSGWFGSPLNSSFGASKIALESIADSLRIELSKWNISISLIELGIINNFIYRIYGYFIY